MIAPLLFRIELAFGVSLASAVLMNLAWPGVPWQLTAMLVVGLCAAVDGVIGLCREAARRAS